LAREVVELLRHAKTVLDGTLGGGGHSAALLAANVPRVIGVDRDPDAIAAAKTRLASELRAGRFSVVQANYADAPDAPELAGIHPDGVLLDLGVSSHQLDDESRGFTFRPGAPLDMRMGDEPRSAADILNDDDEGELARVFREYGDERSANRLAREVVRRRAREPFATSDDFVNAIRGALGPKSGPSDFARLFQAVRIAVNDELPGLERALVAWRDLLTPGGILAIITYHSGEDRIVKHTFRDWSADCVCPPKQLRCTCRGRALGGLVTRKPIQPSADEQRRNPRARSARLRAWRKATEVADGSTR
jgi:16S rRNA (cytosine1402-N4)-methyltransferase